MWKSGFCIFIVIILAIIAVNVDKLMWQTNGEEYGYVDIEVIWGYQDAQLTITFEDSREQSYGRIFSYNDLYNNYCISSQDSSCNDINNISNAGSTYMTCGCFGVVLSSWAFGLCLLMLFTKKCCRCKCRLRWIIAILVCASAICFGISFGTFEKSFSSNVNNILDRIITEKYPSLSKIDWINIQLGGSIILMIICMVLSIISLIMVLYVDRNYGEENNNVSNYPANVIVKIDGPPPVNSHIHYGEPDPLTAPMLQSNVANYKTQQ